MHILITKYFNKEITTEEKAELFSLMQTDKELHKEFVSMQNLSALSKVQKQPFPSVPLGR